MITPLLTTKTCVPPPRPNLVPRPRLLERLDEGLRLGRCLTLLCAPAGFGKTTLVSAWLAGSQRPAAWISLDEGDNDPVLFLHYLVAALQQVDGRIGRTVEQVLQSPQLPPTPSLVTLLINDIAAAATPLVLVLDDYHLISSAPIHELLQFLVEHQPPSLHLIIGTREDPPLPLPRLRARGQVTEIRERDLRFTTEEAAAFLHQTMGLHLSAETVDALEGRTEGWIAGLQLAALALQEKQGDTGAFIIAFRGDNRYIMDYLVTEVLQRQPEATRTFLRQTALLDQLTAPLCDALTGRSDSQAILEHLEAANLFLVPLDHRREWYRYHRLFAESLRTRLTQEERTQLHARAMRWYESQGLCTQAIQHALACAAASGDLDDAERLIRLVAEETIHHGGVLTVRGWLEALPDAHVRADAELASYKSWVLALTGEITLAEEYADAAEASLRRRGAPPQDQAKLLVLRAHIALCRRDYEQAIGLAADALRMFGEDQPHWRITALWAMAESQERVGHVTAAIATFREAVRTGRALANQVFTVVAEMSLALALNNHGQRREAVAACEEAIARYTDGTGRLAPVAGLILSRLGSLYYEANQLEQARRCHEQSLVLCEQLASHPYLSFAQGLSAPVLYALGEIDAALAALEKARQPGALGEGYADADWFLAWEANIRRQQGDLPFALHWAEAAGLSPDDEPQYLRLDQHLVYARLLLVQGRLADARRWLARLERFTQERGLHRYLISVRILQALAAERSGNHSAAHDLLARALEAAAPQDYYRAFLDEDVQVIALLPGVRPRAPAFVGQLLAYAGTAGPRREAAPQPLVEPLSERELEVLQLIAAGLRNDEIARELVIAPGTVKRHINHIYGKLGVTSRTQAVARARELGLLRG